MKLTNANPDIMFERVEDGFELEIIFGDLRLTSL